MVIMSSFVETMDLMPATNPYGQTKAMSEKILMDAASTSDFSVSILRYFNPVGAHESEPIIVSFPRVFQII